MNTLGQNSSNYNKIIDRGNPLIKSFLNDIKKTKQLSKQEELNIADEIQCGNTNNLDNLILANIGLIIKTAKKYQGNGVDLLDLINEGYKGAHKAAEKFKSEFGCSFGYYALWDIEKAICCAINKDGQTVFCKWKTSKIGKKHTNFVKKYLNENGIEPSEEILKSELGISEDIVKILSRQLDKRFSVENNDKTNQSLIDNLICDEIVDPEYILGKKDLKNTLLKLASHLTDKKRIIIELFLGKDGEKTKNYNEIAKDMGISYNDVKASFFYAIKDLRKINREKKYIDEIEFLN